MDPLLLLIITISLLLNILLIIAWADQSFQRWKLENLLRQWQSFNGQSGQAYSRY